MEPVMTVLGVVSVVSLLSTSWGWLKRAFGLGSANQVTVLLTTAEFLPPVPTTALPTSGKPLKNAVTVINDDDVDLATIVQSTTTTAASASSSSSQLGLIILVLVVLGAVGFFVYRKRAKRNQTTARTLGGTPPSPTVSQSEQNRSSLWSNKGDQSKVRNFNIV